MTLDYDVFIFDLYGTLIDVHTDEQAAQTWKKWCRWLDEHDIKHPVYYKMRREFFDMDRANRERELAKGKYKVPEIDIIEVYRDLLEKYGNGVLPDEILNELSYAFRVASRDYFRLFPGVEDFLKNRRAEGKKLYLLSNAQRSYTMPEIEILGLDKLLDGIMISSDNWCMKPDTAFFDMLVEKYEIDKTRAVMLGDSLTNDVEGARRSGIAAIHLSGENNPNVFYVENMSSHKTVI